MTKQNERKLRRLEQHQKSAPFSERSFKHCTEEEIVAMRDAGRRALAGDAAAESELYRMLGADRRTQGADHDKLDLPQATIARRSALMGRSGEKRGYGA